MRSNFRRSVGFRSFGRRHGRRGYLGSRRRHGSRSARHLDPRDLGTQSDGLRCDKSRSTLYRGRRLGRDSGRLVDDGLGRRGRWKYGRTGGRSCLHGLLLARQNGLEGIPGLGDLGEIDLGTEILATGGAMPAMRTARLMEILAHFFGLVDFDGAGVGLFLRDSDLDKDVEYLFAFDFQLASQIVNSNLHPPFISLCLNRSTCPDR